VFNIILLNGLKCMEINKYVSLLWSCKCPVLWFRSDGPLLVEAEEEINWCPDRVWCLMFAIEHRGLRHWTEGLEVTGVKSGILEAS
jgi:hypothetical protein